MTDDTEAQIERAVERWRHVVGSEYKVRTLLQEFAAGRFREPELPAIAAPPFPYTDLGVHEAFDYAKAAEPIGYRVIASSKTTDFAARGPVCATKLGAINLWNQAFEVRP